MFGGEVNGRIGELTESLNRTSEVLTTADKMMDHYRNLNQTQEMEIAKLQEEVRRKYKKEYENQLLSKKDYLNSSSSSAEYEPRKRRSKVHFKQDIKEKVNSFESTIKDLSKRHERLEEQLKKQHRMEEIEAFGIKQPLSSTRKNEETITDQLSHMKNQMEEERITLRKQHTSEMQALSAQVTSLKDYLKELSKEKEDDQSAHKNAVATIQTYKRKIENYRDMVEVLKEEVNLKTRETESFEKALNEMQLLGKMKSSQLSALEEKNSNEAAQRTKLNEENATAKQKLADVESQRTELMFCISNMKTEMEMQNKNQAKTVQELKTQLHKYSAQKEKLGDTVTKLELELSERDTLIERRGRQLSELTAKLKLLENDVLPRDGVLQNEVLQNKFTEVKERYNKLLQSKKSLKEKATNALQDLNGKLRTSDEKTKSLSEEKRKMSETLEQCQNQQKETLQSNQRLEEELKERTQQCRQLAQRCRQYKQHLQHDQQLAHKKTIDELLDKAKSLEDKLSAEREKCLELEHQLEKNLEKTLAKKRETSELLEQVEMERQSTLQSMESLKLRHVSELSERDDSVKSLQSANGQLQTRLREIETKYEECVSEQHKTVEKVEREKQTSEASISKIQEENNKLRRRYVVMKRALQKHSPSEVDESTDSITSAKTIISIFEKEVNRLCLLLSDEQKPDDVIDVNNNYLPNNTYVPNNKKDEISSVIKQMRECHSIVTTLKQRFQQQKELIRRARLKIKSLMSAAEETTAEREKLSEKYANKEKQMQSQFNTCQTKNKQLQQRVLELSGHLKDCTQVLNKSTCAVDQRRDVIEDMERLKKELVENRQLDARFRENMEKVSALSEQLSEAKHSLNTIKNDNTRDTFASKLFETLASNVTTPLKNNRVTFDTSFFPDTTISLTENCRHSIVNPMKLDDQTFNEIFIPKCSPINLSA